MAPRPSWKGFIKLSLVSVPVKAFTASQSSAQIRLNQLHEGCNQRVRYKKVCPEHGELSADQIVSGYEYTKDGYVVIEPEEIEKVRRRSDKQIGIEGFIDPEAIEPEYFAGKTYFLMPDGVAGERPYDLLAKGMTDAGVGAFARIVMSRREQLVLIRPEDGLLTMTVVSYAATMKSADDFREKLEDIETTKEELALTRTLIDASRIEDFEIEEYRDPYVDELKQLIQMKLDGEEVVQSAEAEEPKIVNLMEALKQSVAEAQAGKRKMAPSAKSGATTKQKGKKKKTG